MAASALVLVFEGMLPFLSPFRYRQVMLQVVSLGDSQLRRLGLVSMLVGLFLLYSVR